MTGDWRLMTGTIPAMPTVDELMRRYQDLNKRASDLRSYL